MTTRMLFNEEMRSLNQEIIRMGDLAREMIKKGVQAFLEKPIKPGALLAEISRVLGPA